jgi:hypothetical protein
MGLFYVHQGRSKKKKLPETESLKNARLEHRKFLFSKGIDPDKKINPKEFSAVANWWETTSVQKPAVLAHSVEQLICNHQVASSIPAHGTSLKREIINIIGDLKKVKSLQLHLPIIKVHIKLFLDQR